MKGFHLSGEKERFLFDGEDDEEIVRLTADANWEEVEDDGSSGFRVDIIVDGFYVAGVSGRLRQVVKPDSRRDNPGLNMGSGHQLEANPIIRLAHAVPTAPLKRGRGRQLQIDLNARLASAIPAALAKSASPSKRSRGRPRKTPVALHPKPERKPNKADLKRAARSAAAGAPTRKSSRLSNVMNAGDSEVAIKVEEESEEDAGGGENGK